METRVVIALAIIAVCAVGALGGLAIYLPRRRREKLRRRGVKRYDAAADRGRRLAS